jgi:uncharacterized protein Yka (UPF0111/DUF47 family)
MASAILRGLQKVLRVFVPQEEDFFIRFQKQSAQTLLAAQCLDGLMKDYSRLDSAIDQIHQIEHDADDIAHGIIDHLNDTFVTPILLDREDIYRLTERIDDITDQIKGGIDRFRIFRVVEPTDFVREQARLLLECAQTLHDVTHHFDGLQNGKLAECERINTLENEGDNVLRNALGTLFTPGGDPLDVIRWKEIYEYIEEALDSCEAAANLIVSVVVKNA